MKNGKKIKLVVSIAAVLSVIVVSLVLLGNPKKDVNKEEDIYEKISKVSLSMAADKGMSLYLNSDETGILVDSEKNLVFVMEENSYKMSYDEFITSLPDKEFDYISFSITEQERDDIVSEIIEDVETEDNNDESVNEPVEKEEGKDSDSDEEIVSPGTDEKKPSIPKPTTPKPTPPSSGISGSGSVSKPDGSNNTAKPKPPVTPPASGSGNKPVNPPVEKPNPPVVEKPVEKPKPTPKEEWVATTSHDESIPFNYVDVDDATIYEGIQIIRTKGVRGVTTYTKMCSSVGGVINYSKCKEESKVTKLPIDEVTAWGTKKEPITFESSNDAYNKEVLRLVNEYRASKGIAPMKWFNAGAADGVRRAGQLRDEVESGKGISHDNWVHDENVSYTEGGASPKVTFEQYKRSPAHNVAMLDKSYTEMTSHSITKKTPTMSYYTVNIMQFN